jgi:hypothetical protein
VSKEFQINEAAFKRAQDVFRRKSCTPADSNLDVRKSGDSPTKGAITMSSLKIYDRADSHARKSTHKLKYICYLSAHKVESLYSQLKLTGVDVTKQQGIKSTELSGEASAEYFIPGLIKGGFSFGGRRKFEQLKEEGPTNDYQKLREIVDYCEKHHCIQALNECLSDNALPSNEPLLYTLSGKFKCVPPSPCDFFSKEVSEANSFQCSNKNKLQTIGRIAELSTKVCGYTLSLACSYKYFSDMGGHRDADSNTWVVAPHSGNHLFFRGVIVATFDALFVLSGQKEKTIYGSPIVLVNSFSSDLII